ncbi:hypothetical protein LSH36_12g34021 [Paralvinella palmiformis]|uniref:ceramidase n=1 Tax=Paralvinella palmiformis TaxID=53620 RepID=A0AAD9KCI8_9ANNE|nr:hypothetical protein LSH36_12g34021 [Paralvinella palmiformis]
MVTDALRSLIVQLEFKRQGKTVFKSVNFAGYIGIVTGIKSKLFTLTMNDRFAIDGGYVGILEWILGIRDSRWIGFLTRDVMENATGYEMAKHMLTDTPLLSPTYFILGGNSSRQACVITRSRKKALDVWDLGTRNSSWYILETNYDNWKKALFVDDRRTAAHKCLNKLTQKLTTYTTLMQVESGAMETYLRHCPDPCPPCRDQLLALRPYGGNTIRLAMRPRSGKHPKQIGSDASNLITVPITPYNGTAVQNRNADTKQLVDILRSANLRQHVQERTHRHGHILDLVISRDDDNLIKGVSVSSMLSDHFLVDINVSLQKQSVSAKVISYRRYKSIDKEAFLADLRVSSLVMDPPDDVDHLVDLYDNTLRDIVDQHAPLRTKEMPSRPMLPWYNKNIQAAKRHRRYCERLWIKTSLCVHFEMFKSAYKVVTALKQPWFE